MKSILRCIRFVLLRFSIFVVPSIRPSCEWETKVDGGRCCCRCRQFSPAYVQCVEFPQHFVARYFASICTASAVTNQWKYFPLLISIRLFDKREEFKLISHFVNLFYLSLSPSLSLALFPSVCLQFLSIDWSGCINSAALIVCSFNQLLSFTFPEFAVFLLPIFI